MKKRPPIPVADVADDDDGSAPVALFVQPELTRDARDWIVIYHFLLGEIRTWHSFLLGPLAALSMEEALEKVRDLNSPFLRRAQELFLRAVPLETMH